MAGGSGDLFVGVEAGEDEFDTGGADGGIVGRVDFECFFPCGGDALEAIGIVGGREHIADLDFDAFAEDFADFVEAMAVGVFLEDELNGG